MDKNNQEKDIKSGPTTGSIATATALASLKRIISDNGVID